MRSSKIPKIRKMKEQGPMSGFRDMLAEQVYPRQQMLAAIKSVYEKYGFVPLDTPAIERHETLTGKYGSEGEQLMYKFTDHGGRKVALRYDLTVPLARVAYQHKDEISLPYKRYQVGNVWRGDSPQAGRYREFMQFDADVVGTTSPIADAEIVEMISDTMEALNVDVIVRVNNRRILDALAEKAGLKDKDKTKTLITTIDKNEKIGTEKVIAEIRENFNEGVAKLVEAYLGVKGDEIEKLNQLEEILGDSEAAKEGIDNLRKVFEIVRASGYGIDKAVFDQTIARGLAYYTGIIYETTVKDLPSIGSVCSGGRYDNLIKALSDGKLDLPAVGTSVGVDRLFAALEQLDKLKIIKTSSQVLVANFDSVDSDLYVKIASELRKAGVPTEVFYESDKIGKQIKFANKLGIRYMLFLGSEEKEKNVIKVKDLRTGEQVETTVGEFVKKIAAENSQT